MGIPHLTLVTGGCRSGKSRHAQALVEESRPTRVYVATATVLDSEMADRVARHRADRGAGWVTCEAPLDVAAALNQGQSAVLVDCLTLWLTNLMMADQTDAEIEAAGTSLVAALLAAPGPVVVVTNERQVDRRRGLREKKYTLYVHVTRHDNTGRTEQTAIEQSKTRAT